MLRNSDDRYEELYRQLAADETMTVECAMRFQSLAVEHGPDVALNILEGRNAYFARKRQLERNEANGSNGTCSTLTIPVQPDCAGEGYAADEPVYDRPDAVYQVVGVAIISAFAGLAIGLGVALWTLLSPR